MPGMLALQLHSGCIAFWLLLTSRITAELGQDLCEVESKGYPNMINGKYDNLSSHTEKILFAKTCKMESNLNMAVSLHFVQELPQSSSEIYCRITRKQCQLP